MDICSKSISYILVDGDLNQDIFYNRGYLSFTIEKYNNNDSFISYKEKCSNNETRYDAINYLDISKQNYLFIKYLGESDISKVYPDGKEEKMLIDIYSDSMEDVYISDGISFSFIKKKKYYYPNSKKDLKNGMVIEYFNNGNWINKKIIDLNYEYDNIYNLLIKYDKLRILI